MANQTLLTMTRSTAELTGSELLETIVGGASRTITVQQIADRVNLSSNPITFQDMDSETSWSIDMVTTQIMRFTLTADNTPIALVNNTPGAGKSLQCTLILNQGIGSRLVTWPSNIKWSNGRVPVLSYSPNAEDIVTLLAVGTDTTVYGFFNGGDFSV